MPPHATIIGTMPLRLALTLVTLGPILAALGCSSAHPVPDLGGLYDEAAMSLSGDVDRDPVVVIPGILGSRLEGPGGEVVWGQFGDGGVDPRTPEGRALLSLPADGSDDGVVATQVLDRVRVSLLGLRFEQAAYQDLLLTLGLGGYVDSGLNYGGVDYGDQHFTCFQFPYDWRRELSESAVELHDFLLEQRAYVRAERVRLHGEAAVDAAGPIKFDVVAHSMGGLVLRYYLMYGPTPLDRVPATPTWAGAELVDQAILVGTPSLGAVDAMLTLVDGKSFSPFLPQYPPEVMRTMPAIWQLLPQWMAATSAADGPLDGPAAVAAAIRAEGDAAQAEQARRLAATSTAFHAALAAPGEPPAGLTISLFAADAEPTASHVRLEGNALSVTRRAPGDGTVTRFSALGDPEPGPPLQTAADWDRVQFLHTDHLGMTRDPGFTDNVLFLLLVAE